MAAVDGLGSAGVLGADRVEGVSGPGSGKRDAGSRQPAEAGEHVDVDDSPGCIRMG